MVYFREYGSGSTQNEKKTLQSGVLLSKLIAGINNVTIGQQLRTLREDNYHLWDFGVHASKHLNAKDEVYIDCNGRVYVSTVLVKLDDTYGEIGNLVGWHRIHGNPWKTPVILSGVIRLWPQSSLHKFHSKRRSELHRGFYILSE